MAKPKKREFDLKERLDRLKSAGLSAEENSFNDQESEFLDPLPQRIKDMLGILQSKPIKATTMNYLILYDIGHNKVRALIAKYLIQQGCIRVQKSVFLLHSDNKKFDAIRSTLHEVNDSYENEDSIILVPLNISDARSMKLIGKNVNIEQIVDPPNTLFL
jgi:CRISPR-associated endonuclease Cas2